uniref:Ribosomal RNA-processing protein 8 n=2 Tax=Graphocephala atropunctata TaxID=36148 RepID=A0A1B6KLC6_9HEMI
MGKLKPSILTGLFSHLSMNKKKEKSEYEDLRQISPKSKVAQKRKSKKSAISTLSSKLSIKALKDKNEILLTPSTSNTPAKTKVKKKSTLKLGVKQILDNTKNMMTSTNKYSEIAESPVQLSGPSGKREKYKNSKASSLRERMMKRLKAAKFRYMNEQLYVMESKGAEQMFSEDPKAFETYHDGFRQQLAQWPVNPLDIVIKSLKKRAKSGNLVVADFGCGEAQLAQQLPCTVHSLDLVALNQRVTVCDMAHTPLADSSVDVVVFCLSLMGTNILDYIREANRVLKENGVMKIAEIESRFEDLNHFVRGVERMGFEATSQDLSHNLFYFLDFKKKSNVSKKKKRMIPELSLKPCLYKKR